MRLIKFTFFAFVLSIILSGCNPKDPSYYDMKSPCVSAKNVIDGAKDPCVRRKPLENHLI